MVTIPETFKAFRIHNDAEGYRSGIDDIGITALDHAGENFFAGATTDVCSHQRTR